MKHIHILGVGGTFMAGIAVIAQELGYRVTGSDQALYPPMSTVLAEAKVDVLEGYDPAHLQPHPDVVIVGNVIARGNLELEYVLNHGLHYTSGPAWLAETVLRDRYVIAVAGTHGKTTTTSMITWVLKHLGVNPGFLVGGVCPQLGVSAQLGDAPYFVIEADEYDTFFADKRSKFVHYCPNVFLINNLEFDHADIFSSIEAIYSQFHQLLRTLPENALVVSPNTDSQVNTVLVQGCWSEQQTLLGAQANWQLTLLEEDGSAFQVLFNGKLQGEVRWALCGLHNAHNALAALACLHRADPQRDVATLCQALSQFTGVKRRLECVAEVGGVTVYDDFAHHPTAIVSTLRALRAKAGDQRVIALLQLGSNSMRMGIHQQELPTLWADADWVLVLKPGDVNWDVAACVKQFNSDAVLCDSVDDMLAQLRSQLKPTDHVVTLSNKSFEGLAARLSQALRAPKKSHF